MLFTTCRGGDGSGASKTGATSTPTVDTGGDPATPDAEQSPPPPPSDDPATGAPIAPPAATTGAPVAPPADGCTDAEIKVTPVPSLTNAPAGQTIVIKLRIKNESGRECSRDVGPDEQEIYIKKGAQVIWSSDRCSTYRGSDVKPFPRNLEMEFQVTWNGRQSTGCQNGAATGSAPSPGEYQVFGRLGTDLSTPVKLTLT
ncbi:hypothetical protein RB614_39945 [Phytohabitans sp. ZYX-F-186]|uniref:Intracellular proteinase inhibitor BsuPI domain-containing protein n=1 Tax=Phytohabitans maris TaxID=3071409 RepID=A0ABU0ZXI5_9ACTN|nr:hypothetical protein [Phytohabitans sp. ZYX-F-186]MDQ7910687.1 hypothetical protein [Phytohabitans sp. ZYX-F-186]